MRISRGELESSENGGWEAREKDVVVIWAVWTNTRALTVSLENTAPNSKKKRAPAHHVYNLVGREKVNDLTSKYLM